MAFEGQTGAETEGFLSISASKPILLVKHTWNCGIRFGLKACWEGLPVLPWVDPLVEGSGGEDWMGCTEDTFTFLSTDERLRSTSHPCVGWGEGRSVREDAQQSVCLVCDVKTKVPHRCCFSGSLRRFNFLLTSHSCFVSLIRGPTASHFLQQKTVKSVGCLWNHSGQGDTISGFGFNLRIKENDDLFSGRLIWISCC